MTNPGNIIGGMGSARDITSRALPNSSKVNIDLERLATSGKKHRFDKELNKIREYAQKQKDNSPLVDISGRKKELKDSQTLKSIRKFAADRWKTQKEYGRHYADPQYPAEELNANREFIYNKLNSEDINDPFGYSPTFSDYSPELLDKAYAIYNYRNQLMRGKGNLNMDSISASEALQMARENKFPVRSFENTLIMSGKHRTQENARKYINTKLVPQLEKDLTQIGVSPRVAENIAIMAGQSDKVPNVVRDSKYWRYTMTSDFSKDFFDLDNENMDFWNNPPTGKEILSYKQPYTSTIKRHDSYPNLKKYVLSQSKDTNVDKFSEYPSLQKILQQSPAYIEDANMLLSKYKDLGSEDIEKDVLLDLMEQRLTFARGVNIESGDEYLARKALSTVPDETYGGRSDLPRNLEKGQDALYTSNSLPTALSYSYPTRKGISRIGILKPSRESFNLNGPRENWFKDNWPNIVTASSTSSGKNIN